MLLRIWVMRMIMWNSLILGNDWDARRKCRKAKLRCLRVSLF